MRYVACVDGTEYRIRLAEDGSLTLDGVPVNVDLESIDGGFHYSLIVGAESYEVFVERCEKVCTVTLGGQRYQVEVQDERVRVVGEPRTTLQAAGEEVVSSPMPGVVVALLVREGQRIQSGEGLLILEAMKMENEIRALSTGVVQAVEVTAGQRVGQDDVLVRIVPAVPGGR